MKRIAAFFVLLVVLLGLAGCGDAVSVGGFSSKYMNNDDYEAAVQEVMTYFSSFEGCTMKKIGYAGDAAVKAEADARGHRSRLWLMNPLDSGAPFLRGVFLCFRWK